MEQDYAKFFSAPATVDRQQAWAGLQQRLFDQAYYMKVGDYGSINVLRTSLHDMRPWYNIRFWGMWRQ